VKSHRFLGEETPFPEKMRQILERMQGVPDEARTCRFHSVVAIAVPNGSTTVAHGICEGRIAHEMRGTYGFGYDPIFFLPELGKHMAELPPEEKHKISHRGKALAQAITLLREIFPSM
jgi:XTP/dITP diphosphohydrolase